MIEVELSPEEIEVGKAIAVARRTSAIDLGRKHRYGATDASVDMDKETRGVLGEVACCKWLGVYWPNFGLVVGDVDCGVCEVRAVSKASHCLILHDRDDDNEAHVLAVVGPLPLVHLAGWIVGRAGKRLKNWSDPQKSNRHAYFVPPADLRPMEELPLYLAAKEEAAA
ncbi:hypothetical protein NKJ06_18880 [Mesorhizobium sp. M0293]|uniref:hypothetical protein n=1 Tax=Mesorhizobium sp. M0293 TaxID=2956930 RepID=UPI00333CAE38